MNNELQDIVESTLRGLPETRDSDNKLIYAVYRKLGVAKDESFCCVINKIIDGKLPAFATITRIKPPAIKAIAKELNVEEESLFPDKKAIL